MNEPLRPTLPLHRFGVAAAVLLLLLLMFQDTAVAMASIWLRSSTFTHALLVPPIVGWLIWRQRDVLSAQRVRPMPWMLVPMAAVCLLWLLGDLANVSALTQLALVTLIVMSVPALFGMAVTRAILFPLGFLYFAVPLGDFMLEPMMAWTADFTVFALRLSGIPVYREANQFVIPSGSWSVVEACSGVRYLIASFMVGTLFAYLNYRSMKRRVVFMAASIVVPIIANWLRAYLIVMAGHLSDNVIAAGVDHLIYGWIFFGVVIMAMFAVGARWAEPDPPPFSAAAEPTVAQSRTPWLVIAGILALTVGTQVFAWHFDHDDAVEPVLALPKVDGWRSDAPTLPEWTPAFRHPNVVASTEYVAGADHVGVWVGYYRNQTYLRKLVTPENMVVRHDDKTWTVATSGLETVDGVTLRSADMRPVGLLRDGTGRRLRVWHAYWIGGRYMVSDPRARLQLALNRLLGRGDDAAAVVLYTVEDTREEADALLKRFAPAYLDALNRRLSATRDAR